jgi:hypothetical protein
VHLKENMKGLQDGMRIRWLDIQFWTANRRWNRAFRVSKKCLDPPEQSMHDEQSGFRNWKGASTWQKEHWYAKKVKKAKANDHPLAGHWI